MIIYQDFDQVPFHEITTCEYHKRHPGKAFAGCCCSVNMGWRRGTPEEIKDKLIKHKEAIDEKIADLEAERRAIDARLQGGNGV